MERIARLVICEVVPFLSLVFVVGRSFLIHICVGEDLLSEEFFHELGDLGRLFVRVLRCRARHASGLRVGRLRVRNLPELC